MAEGSWDYEPLEMAVDVVTCELMLETARACRDLAAALDRVEAAIQTCSVAPDGGTSVMDTAVRQMRRIDLLTRLVPSILDPRRIVCMGDRAADNPDWWKANRIHFFCPELTHRQIGELTGLKHTAVRDYIKAVEIPAECYENLPELK